MKADTRRYSISVTKDMDADLKAVKEELYSEDSQSEMFRDLIARGLDAWKASEREIQWDILWVHREINIAPRTERSGAVGRIYAVFAAKGRHVCSGLISRTGRRNFRRPSCPDDLIVAWKGAGVLCQGRPKRFTVRMKCNANITLNRWRL